MPVFNEADGIDEFLPELCENLEKYVDEIIILDDYSTDTTVEQIEKFKIHAAPAV